jgi:hypothetical protein
MASALVMAPLATIAATTELLRRLQRMPHRCE